ncbi:hypothetical protein DPMN_126454 [Dreissena polymorpha]|uniref:Uncharacterized protein n=1 Tax=Dreissena polymorpha TaxID=45954 RepID=A0A9D4JXZ3_DREPO|nr:hypothetical protein DPMN_126454 [Dreissena polymorpha]
MTVCNSARQSLTPSKTVWESPAGSQTVIATSQTVMESLQVSHRFGRLFIVWHHVRVSCRRPDGLSTVTDCLVVSCRCLDGMGDRLAPSGSLLQVPRRSSGTVADCLGVFCRCPDGLGTVADCLGVSGRCPDGL